MPLPSKQEDKIIDNMKIAYKALNEIKKIIEDDGDDDGEYNSTLELADTLRRPLKKFIKSLPEDDE